MKTQYLIYQVDKGWGPVGKNSYGYEVFYNKKSHNIVYCELLDLALDLQQTNMPVLLFLDHQKDLSYNCYIKVFVKLRESSLKLLDNRRKSSFYLTFREGDWREGFRYEN